MNASQVNNSFSFGGAPSMQGGGGGGGGGFGFGNGGGRPMGMGATMSGGPPTSSAYAPSPAAPKVEALVHSTDVGRGTSGGHGGGAGPGTEESAEWSKPSFTVGKIPEIPPPQNVC